MVARWPSDEHIFDHLLDRARRSAVADKISPEFTPRGVAKRHVVAQYLHLFAVLLDRRQRAMRAGRLDRLVQFDVGQLLAPDIGCATIRTASGALFGSNSIVGPPGRGSKPEESRRHPENSTLAAKSVSTRTAGKIERSKVTCGWPFTANPIIYA